MTIQNQLTMAKELEGLWALMLPNLPVPELGVFITWLGIYDEGLVTRSLSRTAKKARKMQADGTPMDTEGVVRYASSVMKNEKLGIRNFDQPKASTTSSTSRTEAA